MCGFSFTAAGSVTASQTPGDCHANQCDGAGNITAAVDNTDVPADDGNPCTGEVCIAGVPSHPADRIGQRVQPGRRNPVQRGRHLRAVHRGERLRRRHGVPDAHLPRRRLRRRQHRRGHVVANPQRPATAARTSATAAAATWSTRSTTPTSPPTTATSARARSASPARPSTRPRRSEHRVQPGRRQHRATAAGSLRAVPRGERVRRRHGVPDAHLPAGACGVDNTAAGTVVANPTSGDCRSNQCDGSGNIVVKRSTTPTSPPTTATSAPGETCVAGAPQHPPAGPGTACNQGGGTRCDGAGTCVECVAATDCASLDCVGNVCQASSCSDGMQNEGETDVDCGGPTCAARAAQAGRAASRATARASTAPAASARRRRCTDGIQNGGETDVDCGGLDCGALRPRARGALVPSDCASRDCAGNVCQAPTCTDGIQNGGETDVDCGGPNCGPCGT